MFNPFKIIGARLFDDAKTLLINQAKKAGSQIMDMAKALDLDGNGVKDFAQVQQDLALIAAAARETFAALKALGLPLKNVWAAASKAIKPATDILHLGSIYYAKYGFKKPSEKVALLQQAQAADVA